MPTTSVLTSESTPFLSCLPQTYSPYLPVAIADAHTSVANSFAPAVSSRSLTMKQAILAASVFEFLGAVLVGARVSGTIKNGIISTTIFQDNAGVQMLAFTCALMVSASWLMIATRYSLPVSTTYSIVSALAGAGVAVGGASAVQWGWNDSKGIAAIFSGIFIAPAISAGFAGIVFLFTKYSVLERENSVKAAMIVSPIYFFTVGAVLTMSIVYKGAPSLNLDELSETTVALAIVLTGLVLAILSVMFWLPYVYCKVVRRDYTLRWFHFFLGPVLWSRQAPADAFDRKDFVPDYRVHGRSAEEESAAAAAGDATAAGTPEKRFSNGNGPTEDVESKGSDSDPNVNLDNHNASLPREQQPEAPLADVEQDRKDKIEGPWILPRNLWIILRYKLPYVLFYGANVDIHARQVGQGKEGDKRQEMFDHSKQYSNETEHLYSFLQVMTSCTQAFAHGSNDVANAIGPFAAIYHIWMTGTPSGSSTETPVWMLAFGGAMIVIGLATYGYNMIIALGNKITLHSPSRGFSMEFGASITVILASQFGIPVSTTMCIVGATTGVGILSGGFRAVNWLHLAKIWAGWVSFLRFFRIFESRVDRR